MSTRKGKKIDHISYSIPAKIVYTVIPYHIKNEIWTTPLIRKTFPLPPPPLSYFFAKPLHF